MAQHPIVHVEISAKNLEDSGKFYHEIFGWEVQQIPDMNYATFRTGGTGPGGGFNPIMDGNPAGTVMVYIDTDDIKASLEQIKKLGGQVLMDPMPIPEVGLFATFKDPTGNTLALLEPHMDQR